MNRVALHRVAAPGVSIDEHYIVEVFDPLGGDTRPVALGIAVVRPQAGVRHVNVVSRLAHDDSHAQDAWAALDTLVRHAGPPDR